MDERDAKMVVRMLQYGASEKQLDDALDFSNEAMHNVTGLNVVAPFKDQYGTVYSSETEAARLSGLPVRLVMASLRSGEAVKGWKFTFVD